MIFAPRTTLTTSSSTSQNRTASSLDRSHLDRAAKRHRVNSSSFQTPLSTSPSRSIPLSQGTELSLSISSLPTSVPLSTLSSPPSASSLEFTGQKPEDDCVLYPVPDKLSQAIKVNRLVDIRPEGEILVFVRDFFKGILDGDDIDFFWLENLVVINQTYRYESILYYHLIYSRRAKELNLPIDKITSIKSSANGLIQ